MHPGGLSLTHLWAVTLIPPCIHRIEAVSNDGQRPRSFLPEWIKWELWWVFDIPTVYSSFRQARSIMFTAITVVRAKTSIVVQCVNIFYKKIRIFIRILDRWSRRQNVRFSRRSNGNRHLHSTRLCVIGSMVTMMSISCKMFRVHTEHVEKRRMPRSSTYVWKINLSIGLSWSMLTTNIQQMMMMYSMFVCAIGRSVLADRIFCWLEWFTHE